MATLPHRIKTARRRAIARLHAITACLAVTVIAGTPGSALFVKVLFGGLAAFAVVDRSAPVIGADAGAVDVVIHR